MVIIGQKVLRENLGIDVMAQLRAYVLKECGRQNSGRVQVAERSVADSNDGAVLPAMTVTAFVLFSDSPGDVDKYFTMMLMFYDPYSRIPR